jgi:hypothetical protein
MVARNASGRVSGDRSHPGNPLGYWRCAPTRPDKQGLRGPTPPQLRGGDRAPEGVSPSCALSQTLGGAQIWFIPKEASALPGGMCRASQHVAAWHTSWQRSGFRP